MAIPSCPIGRRELAHRQRRLRLHIAQQIHELRIEAGITQTRLAATAGMDQGHLSRIERGIVHPSLDALVAIGVCLGADLGVRYFAASGPRIQDRFQAPMIEALIGLLDPRWIRIPEVRVPRARGFVDLALGLRNGATGIECEAHSEVRKLDAVLRRQLEKADALADIGVVGRQVSTLLLLRSTKQNRDLARTYEGTLVAAFPGRASEAFEALRGPDRAWPGPTLLWANIAGGRAEILDRPPRGVRVGR